MGNVLASINLYELKLKNIFVFSFFFLLVLDFKDF